MSGLRFVIGTVLSLFLFATSSTADVPDLHSGKRIASSGDWRLEYRDSIVMAETVILLGDVCTLITGNKNTWLSFGFIQGFVNVTIYANAWDHPRRSRNILLRSGGSKIVMADAVFNGAFVQTSLPPNEAPVNSIGALAKSARNSPLELMRMPGEKLMATFSGRGLEALLDRAIQW